MSILDAMLGNSLGGIGAGLNNSYGQLGMQQSYGNLLNQQSGPIGYGLEMLLGNVGYASNSADLMNVIPRPRPSENDEELWIMDSRDLTFEEWSQDRYGHL